MSIFNMLVQSSFPTDRFALMNNIFATIFTGCWLIYFIDNTINGFKNKNTKKIGLSIIGIIIPFISIGVIYFPYLFMVLGPIGMTVLPNILVCEGGFVFVLLLVVFYYLRKHRLLSIVALFIVGVISFLAYGVSINAHNLLENFQWMMVFASIFILAYNNEKGKGYKNFFYIFYPAHIYILYILGWFLAGRK